MHDQDYDLIGITKAWWAQPHDWNINTEGCSLFRKDRQGIKGECVALSVKAGYIWFAIQGGPGCHPAMVAALLTKGLSTGSRQAHPRLSPLWGRRTSLTKRVVWNQDNRDRPPSKHSQGSASDWFWTEASGRERFWLCF